MTVASDEAREHPVVPFRIDILTIFPQMVRDAANCSIIGRAIAAGYLDVRVHDLRDWAQSRHRSTDDYPFGGGAGMVMLPQPLFSAIESLQSERAEGSAAGDHPVILMAPDGERFDQQMARELAATGSRRLILVCGHYEGLDERVRERLVTREISIGDYVLTGGELAALVVMDATARMLPGVLGNAASAGDETFGAPDGLLLEYPHYTRPAEFAGMRVPHVLLSGHHAKITQWRRQQALARTRARRPDLWARLLPLGRADQQLIDTYDRDAAELVKAEAE